MQKNFVSKLALFEGLLYNFLIDQYTSDFQYVQYDAFHGLVNSFKMEKSNKII